MNHLDSGAANPALNRNQVHPIRTIWPSADNQVKIVDKLDRLHAPIGRLGQVYEQKLINLAELKQAILHKAFTGELTAYPEQALEDAAE